jgi:hypothetical protein
VVAVEKDEGWTFGRFAAVPSKTMPWRRRYASACAVCGAILDSADDGSIS